MTKLVNRAKMTTATTGTGTLTLGSAVAGYQTFANAGVANSNIVRYTIEDGSAWEIGLGTYSSTGTTLTRGTIESSTGTAINLSGNATVFVTAAAGDLQELVTFAETFALPTVDGTNGQVLTTNGSGTLTFSTISGGATNIDGLSDGYSDGSSVGLGSGALAADDGTSNRNTALGINAANTITSGDRNAVFGYGALVNGTTARYSTIIGTEAAGAAAFVTTGGYNTAVGAQAGYELTTGSENTFIGYLAGYNNDTGSNNIGIGAWALSTATAALSGTHNTAIGSYAGQDISTGTHNFLGGYLAGTNLTTGSNNVAIGNGALDAATTGGRNIAIGQDAMGLGVATAASGDNIAIGYQAAFGLTTGTDNIAIGELALTGLSGAVTGYGNVALGKNAGRRITNGAENLAIGTSALSEVTSGEFNVGIGANAGQNITGSSGNVAIGYNSAQGDRSFTTVIGHRALSAFNTGAGNTVIGYMAGDFISSGTNNTVIGRDAASAGSNDLTTGSNNTLLGYQAAASSATVSHEITLGNSSITTLRCQVTTITSLSDARDKTDIQPLNAGLEFVEALNPVSFTWNMRDGGKVGEADTGFIAQDLQSAQADTGVTIPGLVYDVNPDKLEAGYGKLIPVLVQAIKDLSAKVNLLEAQLEAQK